METLFEFTTSPDRCGYLPDRDWQLHYEIVTDATRDDYFQRLAAGWRRFGHAMFRPVCETCRECKSIRVPVDRFRPDRSQRRCARRNAGSVSLEVGEPGVTREKLDLYDRFHAFQSEHKGWPDHDPKDPRSYLESFVRNPFPTEEWVYRIGRRMVGVGYLDRLPGGLSAIYFFHDPDERDRSLGTWNVLNVIERARIEGLPHVYLGYFVEGCRSLAYKANYRPNEILNPGGEWVEFR